MLRRDWRIDNLIMIGYSHTPLSLTSETTELGVHHDGKVHDQLVGCFQWEKGLYILIFPTSLLQSQ